MHQAIDKQGFLINPTEWDEEFAKLRSTNYSIYELSDKHWEILHELRQYYFQFDVPPPPHLICRKLDSQHLCAAKYFSDPLTALKIAGLPNPGEEAKVYLSNMDMNK